MKHPGPPLLKEVPPLSVVNTRDQVWRMLYSLNRRCSSCLISIHKGPIIIIAVLERVPYNQDYTGWGDDPDLFPQETPAPADALPVPRVSSASVN